MRTSAPKRHARSSGQTAARVLRLGGWAAHVVSNFVDNYRYMDSKELDSLADSDGFRRIMAKHDKKEWDPRYKSKFFVDQVRDGSIRSFANLLGMVMSDAIGFGLIDESMSGPKKFWIPAIQTAPKGEHGFKVRDAIGLLIETDGQRISRVRTASFKQTGIDYERADRRPIRGRVHDLSRYDEGDVYDETQTNESIKDGDVLVGDGYTAVLVKAWPTRVAGRKTAHIHMLEPGVTWDRFEDGHYRQSARKAQLEARRRGWSFR